MNRIPSWALLMVVGAGNVVSADVFDLPDGLRSLETVVVGDPGNPPDDTGLGGVAYPYRIGKYEVTAAQYVEFLNAKAQSDPYGLYSENMYDEQFGCKIQRHSSTGSYTYTVAAERANRPVSLVSFWSACRFVNWLHNGQGDGDTETGVYPLDGYRGDDGRAIRRAPGVKWFIPSEDEWYKAAYYDPQKPGGAGYWDYPTRSDASPGRDLAGANAANYHWDSYLDGVYYRTEVGSFTRAASAYGTCDQGGNVFEWTEDTRHGFYRTLRGGSYLLGTEDLGASCRDYRAPGSSGRGDHIGFRVAGPVADTHGGLIAATGASRQPAAPPQPEPWAQPSELRQKILIGTGFDSLGGVGPRFLADHPDFIARYPFDGVAVVVPLDPAWIAEQVFSGPGTYDTLDVLAWSKVEVPYAAVTDTVADLQRVSWGHLTDNFLWCRLTRTHSHNPDRDYGADFTKEDEWEVVEKNASLMARVCREANFRGIMLDTEQYGRYVSQEAYPMGKDTPELVRQRGRQWIRAVQAEYPAVTILIFFAWSPDLEVAGFLKGVRPFLNGVLDGIEAPARLVHAYENTFYYGQGPSERFSAEGFPGNRARYQSARDSMRKWRCFSAAPEKFDQFVDLGMAAWLESDPWDVAPAESGGANMVWSNVPLALAYSDRYVWVWSERTDYVGGYKRGSPPNPYLLSLSNQTFNTGREAVATLTEDFSTNPLLAGWYFDFDILDVGRKKDPTRAAVLAADAVPYVWSQEDQAVRVQGTWMAGPHGDQVARQGQQRRRYVHPLQALNQTTVFRAEFDFVVDHFGADPANPILLGLFHSGELVHHRALTLRIEGPDRVFVTLAGAGEPWTERLDVKGGLQTNTLYRLTFAYDGLAGQFQATLATRADSALAGQTGGHVPAGVGPFQWDEVGVAQWDAHETSTPPEKAYRYRLQRVRLQRG